MTQVAGSQPVVIPLGHAQWKSNLCRATRHSCRGGSGHQCHVREARLRAFSLERLEPLDAGRLPWRMPFHRLGALLSRDAGVDGRSTETCSSIALRNMCRVAWLKPHREKPRESGLFTITLCHGKLARRREANTTDPTLLASPRRTSHVSRTRLPIPNPRKHRPETQAFPRFSFRRAGRAPMSRVRRPGQVL